MIVQYNCDLIASGLGGSGLSTQIKEPLHENYTNIIDMFSRFSQEEVMGAAVLVVTPRARALPVVGQAAAHCRAEGAQEPALHPAVGRALLSSARAVAVALKIRTIDY